MDKMPLVDKIKSQMQNAVKIINRRKNLMMQVLSQMQNAVKIIN